MVNKMEIPAEIGYSAPSVFGLAIR